MADEIRSELSFEAQQAIQTLERMAGELVQYNRAVTDAASGTSSFNTSGATFDKQAAQMIGSLTRLTNAANAASAQLNKVGNETAGPALGDPEAIERFNRLFETSSQRTKRASDEVTRSLREQMRAAKDTGSELANAGTKGANAGKAVLLSWQSVVRIFAIQVIHQAISRVTSAFGEAISEAQSYQTSLAEIQTIGGDLGLSMGELDQRVRQLAVAFGQPLDTVAEGVYQTLSNQVGEASQTFEFLAASQKFATTAVTDADSAVNLLSSTINSFNLNAADAEITAAKLFKTIELGRIRAEEFANTFGRVAVLSNQLGVSLDETLASIATLTVQGLRYNEAFTLITNTQLKLIRPTDQLKAAFNELGVASAEAGIQAFGFQGFLEQLTEVSGDSASEIGGLFNRVRAIRGVLGLTADEGRRFNENLRRISNVNLDEFQEAFEKVFDTDAQQLQRELTDIQATLVSGFGQSAISVITALTGVFGGLRGTIITVTAATAAAAGTFLIANGTAAAGVGIILTYAGSFAALGASVSAATAFLFTTPVGLALLAAGAVTAVVAFSQLNNSIEQAAETQKRFAETETRRAIVAEQRRRAALKKSEDEILSNTQKFLQERTKAYRDANRDIIGLERAAFDNLTQQLDQRGSLLENFLSELKSAVADADAEIKKLEGQVQATGDELDQFNFDRSLRGANALQKSFANIQRSQEFARAAQDALRAGDQERAERLQDISENAAKAALSAADESGNRAAIARAEEQVRDTLRERSRQQQDLVEARKTERELAEGQLAATEKLAAKFGVLTSEIEDLNQQLSEGEFDPKFDPAKVRARLVVVTEQLQKAITEAGQRADLFAGISQNLSSFGARFREGFRDVLTTGEPIDISEAFTVSFDRIIGRALAQRGEVGGELADALEGVVPDLEGSLNFPEDAQKGIAQLPKDIQSAADAQQQLLTAQGEYTVAAAEARSTTNQLAQQIEAVAQRRGLRKVFGDVGGFFGNFADGLAIIRDGFLGIEQEATGLGDALSNAAQRFLSATLQGDIEGAEAAFRDVEDITNTLSARGFPNLAQKGSDLQDQLQEVAKAGNSILTAETLADTLGGLEQGVQDIGTSLDGVKDKADGVTTAAENTTQADNATLEVLKQQTSELQAQQSLRQQGGDGRQFGGLLRAMGGMAFDRFQFGGQRGTDSIPALLTAGESVNTLDATRDFFPQIQAMNAGVQPVFRQEGGAVSNTIGDININVNEASSGRDTAREVMKQIKREFRRNTFNLGRV